MKPLINWFSVLLMCSICYVQSNAQNGIILQQDTTICAGISVPLSVNPLSPAWELVILPPGSEFEYSFDSAPNNWTTTTGSWKKGNAPFGSDNSDLDPDFFYNTFWPSDNNEGIDLYVRRIIDLTGFDLSTINWYIGVDNGYTLYINGNRVSSNYSEGVTYRWEYSGFFPQNFLKQGINIIAIALENKRGHTAFDMMIKGKEIRSIKWSTGETTENISVKPSKTTTYSVTITEAKQSRTDKVTVNVINKPIPTIPSDTIVCTNDSVILNPGKYDSYSWQDGSSQNSFTVKRPGVYSVTVSNQCGSSTAQTIVNPSSCIVYFPNAFTPNGDGRNDVFRVLNVPNFSSYRLTVFNRWGQKVFETSDRTRGWNGFLNGTLQRTDVFIWVCEFQKKANEPKTTMKGIVTLIR
jgi:gliding motility-associated-like protein